MRQRPSIISLMSSRNLALSLPMEIAISSRSRRYRHLPVSTTTGLGLKEPRAQPTLISLKR
ncbi:hypothetical protein EVA_09348 [gut metagenome]|uniref:Uncharacterized protein n=1 Tax=gut metagenome TaxID=749906 RepID=J9GR48_9ZZZZ